MLVSSPSLSQPGTHASKPGIAALPKGASAGQTHVHAQERAVPPGPAWGVVGSPPVARLFTVYTDWLAPAVKSPFPLIYLSDLPVKM